MKMKTNDIIQIGIIFCLCKLVHVYDLVIVHNNDVHAHFEQVNKYSGECSVEQAAKDECFGGEARRMTIIKEARANYSNVLVLDAGDRFSGTLWFTTYKGAASAYFINKENYDAMCLGNHEFDLGVDGLEHFLDNLTVPVVDANIDVSRESRLRGKFNRSIVVERGGEKIGIVGYISTDTAFISHAGGTVKFTDEIEAVRREVKHLKDNGVKIIIGLSHAGYGKDKLVAAEVDGIDVIVGGHSHTFLYTGPQPSIEVSEGPYPTVIKQSSGRTVLVVQAYAWGKYLGFINVSFDNNLEVQSWNGNPILLDNSVTRDPNMLADVKRMKLSLERMKAKIIGSTAVRLEGDPIQCRLRECNTGNLITDAMIWYHLNKKKSNDTWGLASIALLNGGGIRASTEPGPISQGQVLTVLPFGNTIDLVRINGSYIWQAFEHSVKNYDPHDRPGAFIQVSGIRVVYDLHNPPGKRVMSLEARCLRCHVPTYSPIQMDADYAVLLKSFMIKGGDGFDMFENNLNDHVELNAVLADILSAYLQANKDIFKEAEGRIKFVQNKTMSTTGSKCLGVVSSSPILIG